MFSEHFNTVYNEAFAAATQREFTDAETQVEYRDYTEKTASALLARWSAPDFDTSPITDRTRSDRGETMCIKHPNTADFTAEEAYDIAHVRFLGRKIIDAARQTLAENSAEQLSFESIEWAEAHPDVNESRLNDNEAHDIDAPSPQRLRDWPRGDYVNCLGVSIGLAAESENNGTTYAYVNNLRGARYEAAQRADDFFNYLWRMREDRQHSYIDAVIHNSDSIFAEGDAESAEMVTSLDDCVRQPTFLNSITYYVYGDIDTAFHHSVIRQDAKIDSWWTQEDPFALVKSAPVVPSLLPRAINSAPVGEDGACNEIVLLDNGVQERWGKTMADYVELAKRSQRRIEGLLQQYKSPKMMPALFEELKQTRLVMNEWSAADSNSIKQMSDKELLEYKKLKPLLDSVFDIPDTDQIFEKRMIILWLSLMEELSGDTRYQGKTFEDVLDEVQKEHEGDPHIMWYGKDKVNEFMGAQLQNNGALRKRFNETLKAAPFGIALHLAEALIRKSLVHDSCSNAMEVGDPAFQVGSMYMNHYARWREGDIINVAKELARVNPSQLIWQSAVSRETGPVTEDHVMALGALVKSLRIGQQHPLVRITHPPKE